MARRPERQGMPKTGGQCPPYHPHARELPAKPPRRSWARRDARPIIGKPDRRIPPPLSFLDRTRSLARRSWPWLRIPCWIGLGLLVGFVLPYVLVLNKRVQDRFNDLVFAVPRG